MAKYKIKDNKKEIRFYIYAGIAIFALFSFIGQNVAQSDARDLSELQIAIAHLKAHPFDIFPLSMDAFLLSTYLSFIAIALLYIEYLRRKRIRTTGEQGTAEWNQDLKEYNKLYSYPIEKPYAETNPSFENKNMILSKNVCLSMESFKTRRNNNILIVGGSGSGKTRFQVKPNILQENCSFIITDPKGEILEAMGGFLQKEGYKIKVFNLSEMKHSHSYNPFDYIRDENGIITLIKVLIENTNQTGQKSTDPFWEKAEESLLQAVCFYLYKECCKEDQNFSSVMKMLRCIDINEEKPNYKSTFDLLFEDLRKKCPEHIAVRQYDIFKAGAGKTLKSILIQTMTRLAIFNLTDIQKLTDTDDIDMTTVGDEKTALFCITPATDRSYNFLIAMMYTQMFQSLYYHAEYECEGRRLPIPVRFLMDEFANIGTIPEFEQKLATMRSYEISCTIIIQNMAQLKNMYEKNWESITGNCDTFIFLGGNEYGTFEYVSKLLGKETIETQTDSRSFGKSGGSTRNKNIISRDLMTPDELKMMPTNDCVVQIRGVYPFYDKKHDYISHPNYHLTGDADKANRYNVKKEIQLGGKGKWQLNAAAHNMYQNAQTTWTNPHVKSHFVDRNEKKQHSKRQKTAKEQVMYQRENVESEEQILQIANVENMEEFAENTELVAVSCIDPNDLTFVPDEFLYNDETKESNT